MDIFDEDIFDDDLYKLVVTIVQRGYSDEVVFAAKSAGAKGAVIMQGKGVGTSEHKFFGFKIDPENEVVMILVKEELVVPIMKGDIVLGVIDLDSTLYNNFTEEDVKILEDVAGVLKVLFK